MLSNYLSVATLFLCGLTSLVSAQPGGATDTVISVHGSGTTNPSRCYWRIVDQLQSHSKDPIRLTYRAIGSGSGQREFFTDPPVTAFGSGDIPLGNANYTRFKNMGITTLQLPVVLGAISFFYNIPESPHLNLTSCTLAQIFSRKITRWDDPAIVANNPNLNLPEAGLEIRVTRRRDGSSSTASITSYLNNGCSTQWPEDMVGKEIGWDSETVGCQGSGGMTECITDVVGTIGYLDAGHGVSAGLQEVHLESFESGDFISSTMAKASNGIAGAAADPDELPASPTDDFSEVHFINKPGDDTWPIVAMSYIYVRQDISFLPAASQGLLVAFLKSLYEDNYMDQCVENFGFTRVTGAALTLAMEGINSIVTSADAVEWVFEDDTMLYTGAGDNIISSKRNSFSTVHLHEVDETTSDLQNTVTVLESALSEASRRIATLEGAEMVQPGSTSTANVNAVENVNYNLALLEMQEEIADNAQRASIAMAFGAVSIFLWIVLVLGLGLRKIIGV